MQLDNIPPTAGHHTRAVTPASSGKGPETPPLQTAPPAADDGGSRAIREDRLEQQTPSTDELRETVEELSKYTGWGNFDISFSRDDKTDSLVVTLTDRDSGEMIRQFPPEEILSLKSHLRRALGLVFDHMA